MRQFIVAIMVALCVIASAHAQPAQQQQPQLLFDVPGAGAAQQQLTPGQFVTAGELFAGPAPISMSFTLFNDIFEKVTTPLETGTTAVTTQLRGWVLSVVRVAIICVLICAMISVAIDEVSARIPTMLMVRLLLRAGVIVALLGSAELFSTFVTGTVIGAPLEIGNVIQGAMGAAPAKTHGGLFDALWLGVWKADLKAARAVSFFTLEGITLGIAILLSMLFSILFIGFMAAKYLSTLIRLWIMASIAPLAIGAAAAATTRGWFIGWRNSAASAVLALVLMTLLVTVLTVANQTIIDIIVNAPATANIIGLFGSALGISALMFIGATLTAEIPGLSAAITGGVFIEADRSVAALASYATSSYGSAAGWIGGGGGASSAAAASPAAASRGLYSGSAGVRPAGRSLSGPGRRP